ncbi:MAG: ABC transporter ATP-binding protein [Clostridiales bacterium]|jgi:iron complex transport system ATP-binding protein|nr:ABC transporter ATP-binding protein [Clostridiales bacterium]MDR2712549.1 ABC transporter ATP-binding protein [Clostridiales bacterium]
MVREDNLELRVENICGGYGGREVVHGVSFGVEAGEALAILGPNGCGKSTLLRLLLRFLVKTKGKVYCRNINIDTMDRKKFARIFSYIPQSDRMQFPYTVLEMVTMARTCHINSLASPKKIDTKAALECLERLRISHLADSFYNLLSGGQRQLVLIARALCQGTCVLLMDEPTASLDFANQELIAAAIRLLTKKGKIVVFTTHSPSQPFALAHKVLLLDNGYQIGFGVPADILTNRSLESVYGLPMEVVSVTDRNSQQHKICLNL